MQAIPQDATKGIRQDRELVTRADLVANGVDPDDYCLADLRKYPVLSEGGWYVVIKNIVTLEEVDRRPWRLLGPVELLSHGLVLD